MLFSGIWYLDNYLFYRIYIYNLLKRMMITDKLQMIEIRGIMSDKITLLYNVQNEVTVLPNKFIDEYMIKADGEYVKINLLILRLQGMGCLLMWNVLQII